MIEWVRRSEAEAGGSTSGWSSGVPLSLSAWHKAWSLGVEDSIDKINESFSYSHSIWHLNHPA
jgi:hypothetical protein